MALKNRIRKERMRTAVVAAALVMAPLAASAQNVGGIAEETGVRVGPGRLNPVIALESRYDSAAGVDEAGEMKGDTILHIRPGIRFLAPSESIQLKLNANYDYNAYMSSELEDYSKSAADIDFGVLFNRSGDVRFEVTDRFVRSDRNTTYSVGFNSIVNRNDATLRLTALSGDSWSIAPTYTLTSETFEAARSNATDVEANALERYDNLSHTGGVEARYAIASKTALLLDLGVGYRGYNGDEKKLAGLGGRADDVGNARVRVGLTSMLSQKIGLTLKAGYGSQFGLNDAEADGTSRGFSGAIGSAELAWYLSDLSNVRVGFARSFEADAVNDYYSDDRLFVESTLAFTRQLGLRAGLSYDMVGFGTGDRGETVDGRADDIFAFHVGPEYAFNRWFSAGVSYGYTNRSAEFDGKELDDPFVNYDRNELAARVTFSY